MKICDHKSVGMCVWKNDRLLLIERKNFPWGFAPPAGHVDNDTTFEQAAQRELKEEVGLVAIKLKLLSEGRRENICRRKGGTWHYWKIFEVKAGGSVRPNNSEVKQIGWYNKKQLVNLVSKTKKYLKGQISDEEWKKASGLEPVWYEWLKKLKIL